MPIEVKMPRLSDTMEVGTVVKWNVKPGQKVKSGDILADIETDKATMELQSFDDGTVARVAYAGTIGRPYTAIGRTLIAQGELERGKVSLQTIRAWLKSHPAKARAVMESDASFVFFKETPLGDPALGSPGAEEVPLTPGASVAVDSKSLSISAADTSGD